MKTYLLPIALLLLMSYGCGEPVADQAEAYVVQYPETTKEDVTDDFFGTSVADPYRWLEDDQSDATAAWVSAQNKVTFAYLAQIPYRDKIFNRLEQIWNYPKYSAPFKKGDRYYFYKNDGLQNQHVLYYQEGLEGSRFVINNPNAATTCGCGSSFSICSACGPAAARQSHLVLSLS